VLELARVQQLATALVLTEDPQPIRRRLVGSRPRLPGHGDVRGRFTEQIAHAARCHTTLARRASPTCSPGVTIKWTPGSPKWVFRGPPFVTNFGTEPFARVWAKPNSLPTRRARAASPRGLDASAGAHWGPHGTSRHRPARRCRNLHFPSKP